MPDTKNLLTVDETAQYLSCTPTTVRRMLRRGDLRGVKFGKFWRVPREVLRRVEAEALDENAGVERSTVAGSTPDVDALLDATGKAARRAGYKTDADIERLIAEVRAEVGQDTPRRALQQTRPAGQSRSTPSGENA